MHVLVTLTLLCLLAERIKVYVQGRKTTDMTKWMSTRYRCNKLCISVYVY